MQPTPYVWGGGSEVEVSERRRPFFPSRRRGRVSGSRLPSGPSTRMAGRLPPRDHGPHAPEAQGIAPIRARNLRNQEAVCCAERAVGDGRGGGGRARGGGKPGLSGAAWGGGVYGERRRCGRRTRGVPGV